jgi:hypothetical protein
VAANLWQCSKAINHALVGRQALLPGSAR